MTFQNKENRHKSAPKPDATGQMVNDILQELIVVSALGTWVWLKSFLSKKAALTIPITAGIAYLSYMLARSGQDLSYLHQLEPRVFTPRVINWAWRQPFAYHFLLLFSIFLSPFLIVTGAWARNIRTKFQQIFLRARLTNGLGDTPKLLYEKRIDKYRQRYVFDANGIGISDFESRKEQIESHFRSNIESIKHAAHNGQIAVTFTKQIFPSKVAYLDLTMQKVLPKESFYLGVSVEGIRTQKVAELPHLLIAGTTGSGKSVFFKQALLGLLESSPHLQMYLIDLKGGLEMIDFAKAPNVQVIKTMDQAVYLLQLVEKEMKARFSYLEQSQRKQIVPEEDKKDRLVVGVDEASVLYMNRNKHDPDYEASIEARRLADSISKLSRAAAIHLLLATQKLDRQVIPTSVSENISGRMAFRANSLQGSLIVLGTKEASELPEIPGRGIWNFGTQKVLIQSAYVDEHSIQERCTDIAKMYENGKRKLFSPMLGKAAKSKATKSNAILYQESNKTSDIPFGD